jgi:hypothetical protein
MMFSRKTKEVTLPAKETNLPTENILFSGKEKIQAGILMGMTSLGSLGLAAVVQGGVFTRLAEANLEGLLLGCGIGLGLTSLMGTWAANMFVQDKWEEKIIEQTKEHPKGASRLEAEKAIKASKKDRALVASFNIRDTVEPNVDSWRKAPYEAIPVEESTHTVNHYLTKEKRGYRLEQEVIPNEETIWDLSANALVEVYGVKENEQNKTAVKSLNGLDKDS